MRISSYTIFITGSLLIQSAQAQIFTVPFSTSIAASKSSIVANYSFGAHKIIFCYAITTSNYGLIVWPYKGKLQTPATLPIFLKIDPAYDGEFADPMGTIKIKNNSPAVLDISCQFAF